MKRYGSVLFPNYFVLLSNKFELPFWERDLKWKIRIYFTVLFFLSTDSTKINRPGHNIRMYWTNFRQPTAHVQQNVFGKTPIEACSPHLYASLGTFYAQIGQLFEAKWVFEVCLKIDKSLSTDFCSKSVKRTIFSMNLWKDIYSSDMVIVEFYQWRKWIFWHLVTWRCQEKHFEMCYNISNKFLKRYLFLFHSSDVFIF